MGTGTIAPAAPTDAALLHLLRLLKQRDYAFVTPTPATHARVLSRSDRRSARTIEDVLGWSLPFLPGILPSDLLACLDAADMLEDVAGGQRSRIRVSSLRGSLYLHSAYPTLTQDAVFFGPDTYRFADLIARELLCDAPKVDRQIVDIGTGAGVGAIVAATACPGAHVTMTDINSEALRFARINAAAAGVQIEAVQTKGLERVDVGIDIVTINPPYIVDESARTYRDGGGMQGAELSLELTTTALDRLSPGGRVILYTGSAIVRGRDALRQALVQTAAAARCTLDYRELDPDVFGEELDQPAYRDVDRIALIAATVRRDNNASAAPTGMTIAGEIRNPCVRPAAYRRTCRPRQYRKDR